MYKVSFLRQGTKTKSKSPSHSVSERDGGRSAVQVGGWDNGTGC